MNKFHNYYRYFPAFSLNDDKNYSYGIDQTFEWFDHLCQDLIDVFSMDAIVKSSNENNSLGTIVDTVNKYLKNNIYDDLVLFQYQYANIVGNRVYTNPKHRFYPLPKNITMDMFVFIIHNIPLVRKIYKDDHILDNCIITVVKDTSKTWNSYTGTYDIYVYGIKVLLKKPYNSNNLLSAKL